MVKRKGYHKKYNKQMIGGGTYGIYENDIYDQFVKNNINFNGKRCLDIGTRNGLNCLTLKRLGASKVIGIDIDDSQFRVIQNRNIQLIHKDLLQMNETSKFDVITCFLWNMPIPQYDHIMLKIKSLLDVNGIVYIGIHDELYKFDIYGGSVPNLLNRNFSDVSVLDRSNIFQ